MKQAFFASSTLYKAISMVYNSGPQPLVRAVIHWELGWASSRQVCEAAFAQVVYTHVKLSPLLLFCQSTMPERLGIAAL